MRMLKLMVVSLFGLFILVACGNESSDNTEADIDTSILGVATAAKISVVTAK